MTDYTIKIARHGDGSLSVTLSHTEPGYEYNYDCDLMLGLDKVRALIGHLEAAVKRAEVLPAIPQHTGHPWAKYEYVEQEVVCAS